MIRVTEREARTRKQCDSCGGVIEPGDYYLEHVASPDHEDLGNTGWWRLPECGDCAERYGRPTQSRGLDDNGQPRGTGEQTGASDA